MLIQWFGCHKTHSTKHCRLAIRVGCHICVKRVPVVISYHLSSSPNDILIYHCLSGIRRRRTRTRTRTRRRRKKKQKVDEKENDEEEEERKEKREKEKEEKEEE